MKKEKNAKRYTVLDEIRGFALISMIVYHGIWDLVYLFDMALPWYTSGTGYLWQQSICWTFILLSGFCWPMGKRKWKRGLTVFLAGMLITVVSLFVISENKVLFGIMTLLGSCMLLLIPLDRFFKRVNVNSVLGLFISAGLFLLFRNINTGELGFESWRLLPLSRDIYRNLGTAYLGFPPAGFRSSDYFSLFPWFFLFLTGYFLFGILKQSPGQEKIWDFLRKGRVPAAAWLGKHSLLVYILHQPLILLILYLFL